MGRPKGLRKGPDGKWYMPEQTAVAVEEPVLKVQPSAYRRKEQGERFVRNELVSVEQEVGRTPAVVLGYQDSKVVVQGVFTQERQVVAESRVRPQSEV